MTDLLDPPFLRPPAPADDGGHRPLVLTALLGGVAAAGTVLALCMAVALAGWFASDAGAYGDTRDALRVGADAWLLAHGAGLALGEATVTVLPLGLTALSALACFRLGRWAGARSEARDAHAAVTGAVLFAGGYAAVAALTAVLAFHEGAQPHLGRAFLGGLLLALLAGGSGLALGAGLGSVLRTRLPESTRSVGLAAASVVLLGIAAGAALLTAALLADFGSAANVLARLRVDAPDAALYTVLVAAFVPNAAALAVGYLLGPGFALGAGTVVSPTAVVLGPVPAFPLVAALPEEGATPVWTTGLIAVPPLLAAVAVALALRRFPVARLSTGALRGLAAGVLGAVAVAVLVTLAGGSAGPGRMAVVGAAFADVLLAAVLALSAGGLVGGLAAAWWSRRR